MKKLGLSLTVIAFATITAFAQPATKNKADKMKHGRHHQKKSMAMEQLNLTNAQKAEMKRNRADFHKQMKAIESMENQTVKQLRDQRAALAKTEKAKMESLLTTEQKSKLREIKTQHHQKHQEHSAKRFDKMKQYLDLSDNQVATLQRGQEARSNKMKAIKQNDNLDGVAKKQQLKAMKAEMKRNLDNVLTNEQKEKLESRKGEMKNKRHHRKDKMMDRKEVK